MANRRNNWQFCDVITSTPNHPNDLKYFWQTNKKLYYKFMKKKKFIKFQGYLVSKWNCWKWAVSDSWRCSKELCNVIFDTVKEWNDWANDNKETLLWIVYVFTQRFQRCWAFDCNGPKRSTCGLTATKLGSVIERLTTRIWP